MTSQRYVSDTGTGMTNAMPAMSSVVSGLST